MIDLRPPKSNVFLVFFSVFLRLGGTAKANEKGENTRKANENNGKAENFKNCEVSGQD